MALQAEKKIPGGKWVDIPGPTVLVMTKCFWRRAYDCGIKKIYDAAMLDMKKVRCKDGARAECALKRE